MFFLIQGIPTAYVGQGLLRRVYVCVCDSINAGRGSLVFQSLCYSFSLSPFAPSSGALSALSTQWHNTWSNNGWICSSFPQAHPKTTVHSTYLKDLWADTFINSFATQISLNVVLATVLGWVVARALLCCCLGVLTKIPPPSLCDILVCRWGLLAARRMCNSIICMIWGIIHVYSIKGERWVMHWSLCFGLDFLQCTNHLQAAPMWVCVPDAKGFKALRRLFRLFMSIYVAIELLKMQNCVAL